MQYWLRDARDRAGGRKKHTLERFKPANADASDNEQATLTKYDLDARRSADLFVSVQFRVFRFTSWPILVTAITLAQNVL
ncbi:hypothetical protein EG68_08652 [Paragonimus skrjabini miyazakii]|uniref:Uncharacterized protein n=1 Tax=Paragonimus skrjabini miyazakii TaxID=59628 RepID=A0A8S9YP37_9TREM|nr:hypothetical protein EG68_08652 [Paragonimus skrjabini miyazakii]